MTRSKPRTSKKKTFSEHFDLKRTQYDLDFFDCFIDKDTPLFIDPWAIKNGRDDFSSICHQKLQSMFEVLIENIRKGNRDYALELLDNLHEPSETGLGYAKKNRNGSSVGREKSEAIYDKLSKSKAVSSGLLTDLEDTALHIDRISRDNISDIVTNIIRYELIKYTQEQCDLYGIKEMRVGTTKTFWDESIKDFSQKDDERLLSIDGKKILLVPKRILRIGLSVNYSDFYNKGIVEFEQARHFDLRTSLCRTLKGDIIVPPTKKRVKKEPAYKLSRDLVFKYIESNPELLAQYKQKKSESKSNPIGNKGILKKQKRGIDVSQDVNQKIAKFSAIPPGTQHASEYHDHIFDCLNTIFNDPAISNHLNGAKKEYRTPGGRKRIDVKFTNASTGGFFSQLSRYGGLFCAKIFFECKNLSGDLNNPGYDQLAMRFNNIESTIGYVVCRKIEDKSRALEMCRAILRNSGNQKYIMVLTDEDIISLLTMVSDAQRDTKTSEFLQVKLDELISIG